MASRFEQINEEVSISFDFCRTVSNETNNFDTFFICVDLSSQETFNALKPIDFSSAQIFSPLLEMHTNEVDFDLFGYSSKANRRLLILSQSN